MNLLQKYKNYINDNPKGYWFKRKAFGWGWTPATWQGWIIGIYLAIILLLASTIDELSSQREVMFMLVLPLVILTTTFIRIAYLKGESPKWSWGFSRKKHKK